MAYMTVIIRAGRLGLFEDGKRIGSHVITSNVLNIKLNGKRFKVLFGRASAITIYSGSTAAAEISEGVLEYGGEKYRIADTLVEYGNMPPIVRERDNKVAAVSRGHRLVEIKDGYDPVVTVFAVMAFCLSTFVPTVGTKVNAGFFRIRMQERKSGFQTAAPLFMVIGTVLFLLSAQVYHTPPWSTVIITAYVGLLITIISALILQSFFSRITVYTAFSKDSGELGGNR